MHCLLVLAEHRLSNHVFESLAIVPPQPKNVRNAGDNFPVRNVT